MARRVTTTQLVGREDELAVLEQGLADAGEGRSSVLLLGGDSGAGKTRLLGALLERADATQARILAGDCLEVGDADLPYAPLVAALRPLVRGDDPVLEALCSPHRTELARLLPGLAAPGSAGAEPFDASGQTRLFEALLALLEAMSERQVVLLAVEDLHWADPSTRAFLTFLTRNLAVGRVCVVGTFRSDELHRRHPLRPLLTELERDPRVQRIDLGPLTRDQVGAALHDILCRVPEPDLVDRLYARSEGNPLYLEELVAAGADGRGALPNSLREALMVRIERLDEHTQELLRILALGHRVEHGVLADASGMAPADLRTALREAAASQLITTDAHGRHVFRHALLREVVVDDLLPGERTELHLAVARALERQQAAGDGGPQVISGIAHHLFAAGQRSEALTATVRAAYAAKTVRAFGEAASLFERALSLWDQVPEAADLLGTDHVELLTAAADAHFAAGDSARQEGLLEAALAEVDHAAEPARAASLLERLARGQRSMTRTREALETARRALALVESVACPERASLLAFLAKTRMLQGKWRDAAALATDALEAARAVEDPCSEVDALDALGLSLAAMGDLEAGCAFLRQAIDMARDAGRLETMGTAYLNLADVLHLRGRPVAALEVATEAIEAVPVGRSRHWLQTLLAELAVDRGDWGAVEAYLPPPERRSVGNDLLNIGLRRAELALGRGEQEAAAAALDELRGPVADIAEPQYLGTYGVLRAELLRREGDLEGARGAIEEALDRIEFCTEDVARLARVAAVGIMVEADCAQRARDLGEPATVKEATGRVTDLLARLRAAASDGGPVEQAWLRMGEGHAARARGRTDVASWAAAAEAWHELLRPYQEAGARYALAEAHLVAEDREAAREALAQAHAIAQELGAGWLAGQIAALAARGRLKLDADPDVAAPEVAAPVVGDQDADRLGLTDRERQVLALVAQGATNRQIGAELFMAEKTASVHVSRILAKLDVRSRTQAAAVAHRLGLAGDSPLAR